MFAAADRADEAEDRIRAVRDARYKYVRNHRPDLPYGQSIAFRNNLDTMQEILTLGPLGQLVPRADWYFVQTKPVEELCDTLADPYEVENLADQPEHAETLARMRAAHDDRVVETGDLGSVPESELAELYWPGGVQPVTAPAEFETGAGASPGTVEVVMSSPTVGASIAYAIGDAVPPRWRLYTAPITVDAGATVRARAVRYGWAESEERLVPEPDALASGLAASAALALRARSRHRDSA